MAITIIGIPWAKAAFNIGVYTLSIWCPGGPQALAGLRAFRLLGCRSTEFFQRVATRIARRCDGFHAAWGRTTGTLSVDERTIATYFEYVVAQSSACPR